jgi:hypothetical protein
MVERFACLVLGLAPGVAWGQVSIELAGTRLLPSTAVNQHGQTVGVAETSGVTYLGPGSGGPRFAAVMDGGGSLLLFDLQIDAAGAPLGFANVSALTLNRTLDMEGITPATEATFFISEEGGPTVREFMWATGAQVRTLTPPPVFTQRRGNRGFESLTRDDASLWTANEEALVPDGPASTPSAGTVVRVLRVSAETGNALGQWAYIVDAMHGPTIPVGSPGQSGLSDLVSLPGGRLIALERSLALASPLLETRIYEVDLSAATDVSGFPALAGATYTPAAKARLWTGDVGNMEGLALGPQLTGGSQLLVGVVDNGDGLSANQVVTLRLSGLQSCPGDLSGSSDPNDAGYGVPDGAVDSADFFYYLDQFVAANAAIADLSGSSDPNDAGYGLPDGLIDAADFFYFLDLFVVGCG